MSELVPIHSVFSLTHEMPDENSTIQELREAWSKRNRYVSALVKNFNVQSPNAKFIHAEAEAATCEMEHINAIIRQKGNKDLWWAIGLGSTGLCCLIYVVVSKFF